MGRSGQPAPATTQVDPSTRSGAPAGRAVLIVLLAVVVALLLNSRGTVHAVMGMKPGATRTAALAVVRPVDWLAQHLWLDRPKQLLDRMFGHAAAGQHALADSDESVAGLADAPSREPFPGARREPAIVSPTAGDPLRVLVLGDGLAPYLGGQLADLAAPRGLIRVDREWHEGTGITNCEYFDWRDAATVAARDRRAQAVVIAMGAGDFQDMLRQGQILEAGTDQWRAEYARRTALIMQALVGVGVQRIYWLAPPRAATPQIDAVFASADEAIAWAAGAVPGARHPDPSRAGSGEFSYFESRDGRLQRVTQPDGIRWTYSGARRPAELVLRALRTDYGDIG